MSWLCGYNFVPTRNVYYSVLGYCYLHWETSEHFCQPRSIAARNFCWWIFVCFCLLVLQMTYLFKSLDKFCKVPSIYLNCIEGLRWHDRCNDTKKTASYHSTFYFASVTFFQFVHRFFKTTKKYIATAFFICVQRNDSLCVINKKNTKYKIEKFKTKYERERCLFLKMYNQTNVVN